MKTMKLYNLQLTEAELASQIDDKMDKLFEL